MDSLIDHWCAANGVEIVSYGGIYSYKANDQAIQNLLNKLKSTTKSDLREKLIEFMTPILNSMR